MLIEESERPGSNLTCRGKDTEELFLNNEPMLLEISSN